jgi:hypothetical protein
VRLDQPVAPKPPDAHVRWDVLDAVATELVGDAHRTPVRVQARSLQTPASITAGI